MYIIGRNAELGEKVVEQLRSAGGEGKTYEFIKADLRCVSSDPLGERGPTELMRTL